MRMNASKGQSTLDEVGIFRNSAQSMPCRVASCSRHDSGGPAVDLSCAAKRPTADQSMEYDDTNSGAHLLTSRWARQVDKDGNLIRQAGSFRGTISKDDDAEHKPGAFVRSQSEFRSTVSADDPTFTPGETAMSDAWRQSAFDVPLGGAVSKDWLCTS